MMVMMKHRVSGGQTDGELTVLTAARELLSCRRVRRRRRRRRKSLQQAANVVVADQVSLHRRLSLLLKRWFLVFAVLWLASAMASAAPNGWRRWWRCRFDRWMGNETPAFSATFRGVAAHGC